MEEVKVVKKRIWLNILLFAVTILSTFIVGLTWSISYHYADSLAADVKFALNPEILWAPQILLLSLLYAAVLMTILLGHELGHYLTCRRYQINATLPFFIPAPTLVGTLGAFIKIKSPITRKQPLFDIGVAGPLTGFCLSLPALVIGLSLSKTVPSLPSEGTLVFGEPLLLKFIGGLIFKNIPLGHDIILHPVAFAGWVGILVTALNLFPLGQLDGGHIAYAALGSKSTLISRFFLGFFFVMGIFFWVGWLIWGLIIMFLGLKHPRILDEEVPLTPSRKLIGFLVLVIFILSFIPDPIKGYSLLDTIKQFGF
ncbi:MAG: site-2 protease family protein [Candidatus Aminicenantales bacterium]